MQTLDFVQVPEWTEPFLQLFPHRFDFLYAKHTKPGERPEWHSETRYPLSDRMILDGRQLYGVRFGAQTQYLMLDIDRQSPYHPSRDRRAVERMVHTLEPIGLVEPVRVSSSYSGGLHLYFPLPFELSSWELASAAAMYLQRGGFWIEPGYLEIFPNLQNYDTKEGQFSKFNGHRLPLQAGSYLLSEDWNLEYSSHESFVRRWDWAANRNLPNITLIARAHAEMRRGRHRKLSYKAQKFLEDLNTCIEPGWSDFGQTNFILGRITLRSYVFGHVLSGRSKPLTGPDLVADIVKTAVQLPGYEDYCRHQGHIWHRAEEWARCAENSRYFAYGSQFKKAEPEKPDLQVEWNKFQERRAVERICFAIADALNRGEWPSSTTARVKYLLAYRDPYGTGFSCETLYRHADLWHPEAIGQFSTGEFSTGRAVLPNEGSTGCPNGAPVPNTPTNLLREAGVNPSDTKPLGGFWSDFLDDPGRNPLLDGSLGDRAPDLGRFEGD